MKQFITGAAKRLTFSLLVVSALGGCAVYGPASPGPYAYATPADGSAGYVAPAPVYAYPSYPYYYDPLHLGPPVFFNFSWRSWGGHRHHDRGFRGGRGGGFGRGHR